MSFSSSMSTALPSLILSTLSFGVSALSLYFSRKSWRESNRPIVTVRVSTHESGNMAATLNLIIENTGNRPAKNIKLSVDRTELQSAFSKEIRETDSQSIERCFERDTVIPVLANGKSISNSFGKLSVPYDKNQITAAFWSGSPSDWRVNARFSVVVKYQDLDNRGYECNIPILIARDEGFAGSAWKTKNS